MRHFRDFAAPITSTGCCRHSSSKGGISGGISSGSNSNKGIAETRWRHTLPIVTHHGIFLFRNIQSVKDPRSPPATLFGKEGHFQPGGFIYCYRLKLSGNAEEAEKRGTKKGKSLGRGERPFYSFHLLFLCRRVEKGEKNRGRGGALQKSRGKERQEPVMERDSTTMEELSVSFVTESTENATKVSKKGF